MVEIVEYYSNVNKSIILNSIYKDNLFKFYPVNVIFILLHVIFLSIGILGIFYIYFIY
jgi:hypothetical protein